MRKHTTIAAAAASLAVFALAACSQGTASSTGTAATAGGASPTGTSAAAPANAPAPFDKAGGVKIAIVQNSGQGDYFQQYLNGTQKQVDAIGGKLDVYDAKGDNAQQAQLLEQAIATNPDGIIVRHGNADTMCPGVNEAIQKKIPIVIYDVEIQKCSPDAVQTQQSDKDMAGLVLDQMLKDVGAGVDVGYVNVLGIAPLDRRDAVWKAAITANQWNQKFFTGKYSDSTATDTAPMVVAALQANPSVKAIYAPYDELTKGTLSALQQLNITNVKVYGADISTADIGLMTADGSPWMATGATDPNAIGAAVTRTLFLEMAGKLTTKSVDFPPILITQDMLRQNKIANMDDLRKAEPALNISTVSSADWIPAVTF
jgi:simple sugar transport system substrate-binding protein